MKGNDYRVTFNGFRERKKIMQLYVCSRFNLYSKGEEHVRIFNNKQDAYNLACTYVVDFMEDAFECNNSDFIFMKDCWNKRDYEEGFKYWKKEIYLRGEIHNHPIIDVYPVIVE
jgi:hypothetical protein